MGTAIVVKKYRYKGWFGRDKFRFQIRTPNGDRFDYKAWSDEYHSFGVGDHIEHPSIPNSQGNFNPLRFLRP